jgi:hypothetical protein
MPKLVKVPERELSRFFVVQNYVSHSDEFRVSRDENSRQRQNGVFREMSINRQNTVNPA